ncbi:hypothetical protein V8D89_004933 [Ganoderma adspersum]
MLGSDLPRVWLRAECLFLPSRGDAWVYVELFPRSLSVRPKHITCLYISQISVLCVHPSPSHAMSMPSNSSDVSCSSVRKSRPSRWPRIREYVREPAAEFLGVMILVIFGNGAACQTTLSSNTSVASTASGDALSVDFGFAVGLSLGAWVTSGISPGHINPAVMGGLCGAGIVYANYIHAIDLVEGGRHIRTVPGTAGLFATYALPYMIPVSAWFEEFLGTVILLIVVCAMCDPRNGHAPPGFVALILFITMIGISAALGMQTGFAINPARDLGPRLLTAMAGYGSPVFTFKNQYWLWCPVLAPIVGALVGVFFYDLFFYSGSDSILSKRDKYASAKLEELPQNGEAQHLQAGPRMV